MPPELSVVLPCFNEADNLGPMLDAAEAACAGLDYEILFVNDGSTDRTGMLLQCMAAERPRVRVLNLVKNAGHQNALRAGLKAARGGFIATLDADLQHPPEFLPVMLQKAREGYEVIQMVRHGSQEGLFKNFFSWAFYRIFNLLSDIPIAPQAADFRLISRRVCDVVNGLPERNLLLRAILPQLGFRTLDLAYAPHPRHGGKPVFTLRKSLALGSQALFDFSTMPLRLGYKLGLVISLLAFLYGAFNVAAKFLTDWNVPGYTDIIASVLFLGGLILFYQGLLGRYLLVVLEQIKARPEYLPEPEAPKPFRRRPDIRETSARDAVSR